MVGIAAVVVKYVQLQVMSAVRGATITVSEAVHFPAEFLNSQPFTTYAYIETGCPIILLQSLDNK